MQKWPTCWLPMAMRTLTCYRADGPKELIARQVAGWDPLLDWADATLGARLLPVEGVVHVPQDPRALGVLSTQVHALDAYALTAFHDLVSLSGSLIIGFAALYDLDTPHALWQLSRIDELWQEEQWGEDEEAREMAARKESDFYTQRSFIIFRVRLDKVRNNRFRGVNYTELPWFFVIRVLTFSYDSTQTRGH